MEELRLIVKEMIQNSDSCRAFAKMGLNTDDSSESNPKFFCILSWKRIERFSHFFNFISVFVLQVVFLGAPVLPLGMKDPTLVVSREKLRHLDKI